MTTPQSLTEEQKAAQRLSPDVLGDQKDKGKAALTAPGREEPVEVSEPSAADEGSCDSCGKVVPVDELTFNAYESNGVGDGSFCEKCSSWDGR